MFHNPQHSGNASNPAMSEEQVKEYFEAFYEDVFCELVKFGNLLEMHVCDNVGDHLIGNVYARYEWEDEAQAAVDAMNDRWYSGRPLYAELSPVTDFREACCRQNDMGECNRGGFCNFMHLREPPTEMLKELHAQQRMERRLNPSQRDIERKKEVSLPLDCYVLRTQADRAARSRRWKCSMRSSEEAPLQEMTEAEMTATGGIVTAIATVGADLAVFELRS